jgi:hypothetical protein
MEAGVVHVTWPKLSIELPDFTTAFDTVPWCSTCTESLFRRTTPVHHLLRTHDPNVNVSMQRLIAGVINHNSLSAFSASA